VEPGLRVLVVSPMASVRAGLRVLLEGLDGIGEVTESGPDALAFEQDASVDAILFDAGEEDDEALDDALAAGVPVVVLGGGPPDVPRGSGAGGGNLRRDAEPEEIAAALRAAARGLLVFDAASAAALSSVGGPALVPSFEAGEMPTEREMEVLSHMARGLANKQIAREMGISEHTVKFHVSALLGKLGAAGRTEAVTIAVRRGLLSL
jgi:DNA-binding NarL/FixJ family response regulator